MSSKVKTEAAISPFAGKPAPKELLVDLAQGERSITRIGPTSEKTRTPTSTMRISDELPTEEPWAAERAGRTLE